MTNPQPSIPRATVTPYLIVDDVDALIDFCSRVFGATLDGRLSRPDGSVMHAEVSLGGSAIMMGEPMGEFGPTPGMLFVDVPDCAATYTRAIEAGAESVMEVTHMRHAGERYGGVRDANGNTWWISTHVEDVTWEEQQRRIHELVDQGLGS